MTPVAPPPGADRARSVGLVLSALVVPLAVSGYDLVNRRALAGGR